MNDILFLFVAFLSDITTYGHDMTYRNGESYF